MTRSEALEYFKEELKDGKCSDTCPICNANEWAVKALEEVDAIYERANQKALDELPQPTLTTAGEPIAFFGPIGIEPYWHPYPEEEPQEFDKYLVVKNSSLGVYYDIVFWGKSKWIEDAQKEYKKRAAYWYQYDPEWGDYTCDNVVAWMLIPEYKKEKAAHKQTQVKTKRRRKK